MSSSPFRLNGVTIAVQHPLSLSSSIEASSPRSALITECELPVLALPERQISLRQKNILTFISCGIKITMWYTEYHDPEK